MLAGSVKLFLSNRLDGGREICVIFQILKRKLKKLLLYYSFLNVKFLIRKRTLFIISKEIGAIYKTFLLLQAFDRNIVKNKGIGLVKKKLNKEGGCFLKTDITEEASLFKEEAKIRVFKKLGKKYKPFLSNSENRGPLFSPIVFSKKFFFKNIVQLGCVFPNNNLIDNNLSTNIIVHSFKNFRNELLGCFLSITLKNSAQLFLVLNYIMIMIRLKYYFFIKYANDTSGCF